MILIKLIFANVTWWDIDWHPRLEDRKIDTTMRSIPFNFLIPYNELQEKTRWNTFKRVYKALEELEKGKPCKKTLFTCKKSRDEISEAFSQTPFRHYKTTKIEVWIFEKVNQIWLKWFNVRKESPY